METSAAFFGAVLVLAFLVESLTEYICGLWLSADYIRYAALAVGVVVAVLYGVDALKVFFGLESSVPYAGEVLTGLVIGRGSNYVHDLYSKYIKPSG